MSEEDNREGDEIEVRHTYSNGYRLHPATGVTGGYQPQGKVKIDFVYDHGYQTQSEKYDREARLLSSITMNPFMTRERQVGVSMNRQDAYESAIWIIAEVLGEGFTQQDVYDAINDLAEDNGQ